MATTNLCLRGGFVERFATSSSSDSSSDYWSSADNENMILMHNLDTKPIPKPENYICLDMDMHNTSTSKPNEQNSRPTQSKSMPICTGCRMEIADRFILRVNPNLEFHAHCLKCCECNQLLDENQTAFVKNGQTYCRADYMRIYTTRCTRCSVGFEKTEMVMRAAAHVFHMDCFSCTACERRLDTGDEFQIKNNRLYCRADCESGNIPDTSAGIPDYQTLGTIHNNNNNTSFDDDSWETSTLTSLDNHTTSPPLSPKSDGMRTPLFGAHGSGGSSSGGSSGNNKKKKDKQTTRVRTVLNEAQLGILKNCYAQNARPDSILKEKLVEMTGLNARVIRVWFQNKRCKDKKRHIQMQESQLNTEREEVLNRVRVSGIGPLMVAAPTNHVDGGTIGGPVDITHYAQWTAPPSQFSAAPMMYPNNPPDMPPFGGVVAATTTASGGGLAPTTPGDPFPHHFSPPTHGASAADV